MSKKSNSNDIQKVRVFDRRHFLKLAGSAAIFPAVIPALAAQSSETSANNRINVGVIGMGMAGAG